jgi:hypothetical protein
LRTAVRQLEPSAVGYTQASSVIPFVRSSEAESATSTRSFTPSKESAEPKRPGAHVAPETAPALPRPDESSTAVPAPS